MSTEDSLELRSYPTQERMSSTTTTRVTFRDLLFEAAKAEYGQNITVRDTVLTSNHLEAFKNSISIKVLRRDDKPSPVGRTIVDISTKEFKNYAAEDGKDPTARDTTKATVTKSTATSKGRNYEFTSTQGVSWDIGGNVGLQILAMGMAGGSFGVGGKYGRNKSKSETVGSNLEESLGFEYSQEETICVPPGKKVHVTITTYTVQYRLNYTLEFSVPKSGSVFVSYSKSCCCGLCSDTHSRYIPYSRIVRTLPNFREDNQNAYFTEEGFLSWIGESCEVDKREAPVSPP